MLNINEKERFCKARRRAISLDFKNLNSEQLKGVMTTDGPVLLLAGAGSGKTTVLINRIANLIKYGRGSDPNCSDVANYVTPDDLQFLENYADNPTEAGRYRAENLCKVQAVAPWSIIAITFTNKAADELKQRLDKMLFDSNTEMSRGHEVWAFTFHSACVRILRRDIDTIGIKNSFTIYDTDDCNRIVKDILKNLNIDEKNFSSRSIMAAISNAKNSMRDANDYANENLKSTNIRLVNTAKVYLEYEKRLHDADALDFDDLILDTVRVFEQDKNALEYWQNRFKYVLVDEYQDTNQLQYKFVSLLSNSHKNICVVGDDDQSIYRFRGATIENILNFEDQYKNAVVIRLEQNYRSTQNILDVANTVIKNNSNRKGKTLWTKNGSGEHVKCYCANTESEEAQYVASHILNDVGAGKKWSDHAVLYRMNAQSNAIEFAFKRNSIPYKVVGGLKFFDRAEVKDVLSYLCVINNPFDDLHLRRIINNPTRGIGNRTIDIASRIAYERDVPLYNIISGCEEYSELQKSVIKLKKFVDIITTLQSELETDIPLYEFYDKVLDLTGYRESLKAKKTLDSEARIENINELRSTIVNYVNDTPDGDLKGFLDTVALYTDLDSVNSNDDVVTIMTMHSAKGLEFPVVFVVGVEQGIFPGIRTLGSPSEIEEERRLCYVAFTRAKEQLHVTYARRRMLFGRVNSNKRSQFIDEMQKDLVDFSGAIHEATEKSLENENSLNSNHSHYNNYNNGESTTNRQSTFSRPRRSYRDSDKPVGGGISVKHEKTPTGHQAFKETVNLLNSFKKGDIVQHTAFGKGEVIKVMPMGGDALLEILFENNGSKMLMLKTAMSHLTKL